VLTEGLPAVGGRDAWLWPEGQGVRWWTPAGTTRLDLTSPGSWNGPNAIRELRDRRDRLGLRFGLARPLGELIAAELTRGRPLRLHLSRALAPAWHACPYEWFTLDGASVFGSLLAERQAPAETSPLAPVDPRRPIALLNLLARDEPVQPADAVPAGAADIIDGPAAVAHYLDQVDVAGLGALVVVAHGTECDGAHPFRLPDGAAWGLPLDRGLPPLVILLACGTDTGNLVIDACRMLAAGAVTVLAPLGRPCPAGAGRLLAAVLPCWRAGQRVDQALLAAQLEPEAARGACLMQVLGRGDLRMDARARPEELADQDLAAADGGTALRTLIDRLTLRCFQTGQELDQAEAMLRDLLRVRWYDETAEKRLFAQLQALGDRPWRLSRAWVRPLEALLAEAYDHSRLPALEQARRALDRGGLAMPAPVYHYWSKIAYRQGRYALALQDVARGLALVRPDALCTRAAGLVGHLVGLLVDVDLPGPAAVLHQQMEDCLAHQADEKSDWERHKLMDRAARIALRLGQAGRAQAIYRLKRQESRRFQGDGTRELAWLLYLGAWTDPQGAAGLAAEAQALLTDESAVRQGLGPGNVDPVYLLRAYAAWAWRACSGDACRLILGLRDRLEHRLFAGDAGPPGFVFAFLHLCRRSGLALPGEWPPWDAIAAALENQRYYLELAAFSALAGDTGRAAALLQRVQSQRTPPDPLTFPDWLGGSVLTDWEGLVAGRAQYEQTVLASGNPLTPEALVSSGLLPL
jgi:hypothetical protein